MLLAVDIGNTSINFGLFGKSKILDFRIPTLSLESVSLERFFVKKRVDTDKISEVIICSVVPKVCQKLKGKIKESFKVSPLVLGEDIFVPIKNLYKYPKQVGQDRLVNAYAAKTLYGYPLIIVDFGTAITFDIISKKGDYLGGIIAPGVEISKDVLSERTALLPKVKLRKPKVLIGKDTEESILSGIFFGFGCLVDGLLEKLKAELRRDDIKIIATGGNIEQISPFCRNITKVDSSLTLKGILFVSKFYHKYRVVKQREL